MTGAARPRIFLAGCAALLLGIGVAHAQSTTPSTPPAAPTDVPPLSHPAIPIITPPEGKAALVPLGDAANGEHIDFPATLPNPFQHDPAALADGKRLFTKMNCAGCHGYDATGAMGPNLTDQYWRYGGTPVQVFKSIYEGRPEGMPAWGGALSIDEVWHIVAYLESLGGTFTTDFYRQAKQGDHPGDLIAKESTSVAAEPPPKTNR